MNVLDIRSAGTLSVEDAKTITIIEKSIRSDYNEYICEFAKVNHIKNSQWLLRATCRNTYISKIHDSFCRLALLEQKLSTGEVLDSVLVDNKSIAQTAREILKQHGLTATVSVCGYSRIKPLQTVINIIKSIYLVCNLWMWSKLVGRKRIPSTPIVLLDMFLLKDSFNHDGYFTDRYFPNLISLAPAEEQESIWYFPSLHGIKYPLQWIKMFRNIAKSPQNILLKEQWLTLIDYFSALKQAIALPSSVTKFPLWHNYDVSRIILEELKLDCGSPALVQALLMRRSFKRFKKGGVQIKGVIDWFENQVGDRAVNLGVRSWYPEVQVKGYLGFVPEGYYAGLAPLQCEEDGGVLPNELLLLGEAYVENQSKYLRSLQMNTAPAFRFQTTIEWKPKSQNEQNKVLLAMPMLLDEAKRVVQLALAASDNLGSQFVIKPHPTISTSRFKEIIPESNNQRFTFSEASIVELFPSTKLLVTTASSVALEAVLCNIHVAIIGNQAGPTINPLEGIVQNDRWSICYTPEELEECIDQDSPRDTLDSSRYLTKVTPEGVLEMLRFETP